MFCGRKDASLHAARHTLRRAALLFTSALAFACSASWSAELTIGPALPAYVPGEPVSGVIVCAGNHATDELLRTWAEKFARYQPGVQLRLRDDTRLTTDAYDTAIAANDVDLIPSAREPVPSETERLTKKLGGPPLVIAVATGSYATKSGTHALAFYVNSVNPLGRITIEQIRQIYAPNGKITKWGQLGLAGEWADQTIHVFSVPVSDPNGNPTGIINYLQKRIFGGTQLRRSIYQVDSNGPAIEQHMLNNIVRQVAEDRYAIGFSGFAFAKAGAKTLQIAETETGPYYRGTHDEVLARSYPLTRTIYLGANQAEGKPLRPATREFLRFILSREGQATLTEGVEKYLPLPAAFAAAERLKLN